MTVARGTTAGTFSSLAVISAWAFVPTPFGAQVAIDDAGDALVSWVAEPVLGAPAQVLAAQAAAGGAFAPPQELGAGATATAPALGAGVAQVAWVGAVAVQVVRGARQPSS